MNNRNLLRNTVLPILLWIGGTLATSAEPLIDGPYVFHENKSTRAVWVCDGEVKTTELRPRGKLNAPCGDVTGFALNSRNDIAPDSLPQPKRWAAVSDIHGQTELFLNLLRAHKIVGNKDQWTFGKNVLIVTGDVFDRGPQQTEALWTIYRLAQQAKAAGGSVQMLLGNHETMVLRGDLRYLHPKYPQVAKLLDKPFKDLYAKDTELGQWLRTRASVLKMGDTVFLHGGISPDLPQQAPDLVALNAKVRARLGDSRDALRDDAQASWLFGTHGPFWYRGYFYAPRASSEEIDAQLKQFAVKRIVVGHTTRGEIISLYGGRVIGIDAELKEGVRGELLLWENNQLQRGLLDGSRLALLPGDDDGSGKLPPSKND
ncbi:MAG: metallophosphoesterase [Betaproteobacteria bacterium]|nr:metallophosphoesterase [Betaproteobacteria bacterium]